MKDERDALGRGHRFEHDEEGHVDRLVEGNSVGRVDRGTARPPGDPLRTFGQRLREPFAHVALAPGPCRAEQVETDAAGDLRQPGAGGFDGRLSLPGHAVPAGVGLLYRILGLGQGAEEPVREIDQLTPLAHDRAQARIGPAVSWLGLGGHGAGYSVGRICPHQFDETPHRTVRLARRLTFRGGVSSYCSEEHTIQRAGKLSWTPRSWPACARRALLHRCGARRPGAYQGGHPAQRPCGPTKLSG